MAWVYYVSAVGGVSGSMMTSNDPAPVTVEPSNRNWVPAVNPYATGRAMAPHVGSEIVFRGDTRGPDEIEAAGGLWAHKAWAIGTGGSRTQRNPHTHQASPGNTIYVSCSRDLRVAKGFAYGHYVYVFRVNAGVDYNGFAGGNASQAEVMAIEGIRLEDIIAVRRLQKGDILVNNTFRQGGMSADQWRAALTALAG